MRLRRTLWVAGMVSAAIAAPFAGAQATLVTELKLGVDRTKVRADRIRKPDTAGLETALDRRVAALVGAGGTVEVQSVDEIRVRLPLEKVTDEQLRMLTRPGRLEVRRLDDIYTNLNPDGRYIVDVLAVQDDTKLRFRDRRTNTAVPTERLVGKAPLLFDNDDLAPDGAHAVTNAALVRVRLTEKASKRLEEFLKRPGRLTAVVVDGEVVALSAGTTVQSKRPRTKRKPKGDSASPEQEAGSEVDVPGGFQSAEEAALLANVFNSGVLPFPLTVRSRRIVPGD